MTFEEWFEENRDKLKGVNIGGVEALYKAWLAGYEAGLAEMGKFAKELWSLK